MITPAKTPSAHITAWRGEAPPLLTPPARRGRHKQWEQRSRREAARRTEYFRQPEAKNESPVYIPRSGSVASKGMAVKGVAVGSARKWHEMPQHGMKKEAATADKWQARLPSISRQHLRRAACRNSPRLRARSALLSPATPFIDDEERREGQYRFSAACHSATPTPAASGNIPGMTEPRPVHRPASASYPCGVRRRNVPGTPVA